ncbi:MAG: winged helix-turn-helix transcriptional regulator [Candidatus Nitrosocaldus sp.]
MNINRKEINKNKPYPAIEIDNRYRVLHTIKNIQGIRYMELKRLTGLSYGTLTYHLTRLEREGRIRVLRSPRKSRYYTSDVDDSQADIIDCIRSRICKDILAMILKDGTVTLDGLAKSLKKAKITIKYHIERLKVKGIIEGERIGRYIFYRLKDSTILNRVKDALLSS